MFENIQEIKKYVNVSAQLDVKLLQPYLEEAIRVRIYPYIPKSLCNKLINEPYYELLKKAVANYAVAYSIPFLKVHLSNTGGNNFSDGKMQKASWWDLRDLGLSAVSMADRAISDVLQILYDSSYASEVSFFNKKGIFEGLWQFENYYSLNNSWEVYVKLLPVMDRVWQLMIAPRLGVCTIDDLRPYKNVWENLQTATAYFSVAEMIQLGNVSFTMGAMIIQWEELPWQQSKLLSGDDLDKLYKEMTLRANLFLNKAIEIIRLEKKRDANLFACFTNKNIEREVIVKKSGLYF